MIEILDKNGLHITSWHGNQTEQRIYMPGSVGLNATPYLQGTPGRHQEMKLPYISHNPVA